MICAHVLVIDWFLGGCGIMLNAHSILITVQKIALGCTVSQSAAIIYSCNSTLTVFQVTL